MKCKSRVLCLFVTIALSLQCLYGQDISVLSIRNGIQKLFSISHHDKNTTANILQAEEETDERTTMNVLVAKKELVTTTISSNLSLHEDMVLGNVNLVGGEVRLNGHKLEIEGELSITGGKLNVDRGSLIIRGNYSQTGGALIMQNDEDYMLVEGNLTHNTYYAKTMNLSAGILELKGNMKEEDNTWSPGFYSSGSNKVILSGEKKQIIELNESESNLASVVIENTSSEGVEFKEKFRVTNIETNGKAINLENANVKGWILDRDTVINGNYRLDCGTLDLNGYTLEVKGNFRLNDGDVRFNKGYLKIEKDYVQTGGTLAMTNEEDYMLVEGNLTHNTYYAKTMNLSAGTLELKGNMEEIGNTWAPGFFASGTHVTLLSGSQVQTITIGEESSKFAKLILANTSEQGVVLDSNVKADHIINEQTNIQTKGNIEGWQLDRDTIIHGDLNLGSGELNLNGFDLVVEGKLSQLGGRIVINGGQLFVKGDYRQTAGTFLMDAEKDYVCIEGEYYINNYYSRVTVLKAGIMELKGNFTQIYNTWTPTFEALGTNKVVLDGKGVQDICFQEDNSSFNALYLTKDSQTGYTFNRPSVSKILTKKEDDTQAPTPVTHITSEKIDETQLKLSWEPASDNMGVLGYEVLRNNEVLGFTTRTYFKDTTLSASGTYTYTIITYDLVKNQSEASEPLVLNTEVDTEKPTAPTRLRITSQNADSVSMIWESSRDNIRVAGYHVYRNGELIGTTGPRSMYFTDKEVEQGLFTYTVTAYDEDGNESYISNSIKYDNVAPTVPLLTVAKVDTTSVELMWPQAEDNVQVKGYELYRDNIKIATTKDTRYQDSGLINDHHYKYQVRAVDSSNNYSEGSAIIDVYTSVDMQAPTTPTELYISSQTAKRISLTWKAAIDNISVQQYEVYRDGEKIAETNLTTYTDNGLEMGIKYSYSVKAVDGTGNVSEMSECVEGTCFNVQLSKVAPIYGTVIGGEKRQTLCVVAENHNSFKDASAKVEIAEEGGEWQLLADKIQVSGHDDKTMWFYYDLDMKELSSAPYRIRYTVTDASGVSDTAEVIYLVDRTAPDKVKSLKATAGISDVTLTFEKGEATDIKGYHIYRGEEQEGEYGLAGTVMANEKLQYTESGLDSNKSYYYKVAAFDQFDQEGEASDSLLVKMNPESKPVITITSPLDHTAINEETIFSMQAFDAEGKCDLEMAYKENGEWKTFASNEQESELSGQLIELPNTSVAEIKFSATDLEGHKAEVIKKYEIIRSSLYLKKITIDGAIVSVQWDGAYPESAAYYLVKVMNSKQEVVHTSRKLKLKETSYKLTELDENTQYTIIIERYNASGKMQMATKPQVFTTRNQGALGGVSVAGPQNGVYQNTLPIQFNVYHKKGLGKVVIEKSRDLASWEEVSQIGIKGAPETYSGVYNMDLTKEEEGKIYIRLYVESAKGERVDAKNFTVLENTIDRIAPQAVSGLNIEKEGGKLKLTWQVSEDKDVAVYSIRRMEDNEVAYTEIGRVNSQTSSMIDYSAVPGKSYTYRIYSMDLAGNVSTTYAEAKASLEEDTTPPTILETSWDTNKKLKAYVNVCAQDDYCLSNVRLYIKRENDENYHLAQIIGINNLYKARVSIPIEFNALQDGKNLFWITATDVFGNEAEGKVYEFDVNTTPPEQPELTAEATDKSIVLSINGHEGDAYYKVYREEAGKKYLVSCGASKTYIDTNVKSQKSYTYYVIAVNEFGNESTAAKIDCRFGEPDQTAPVINLYNLSTPVVGTGIWLDASQTTDDSGIKSYIWEIDGVDMLEGSRVSYCFNKVGTHKITLSVTDVFENEAKKTFYVDVVSAENVGKVIVNLCDKKGNPVNDATVYIASNDRIMPTNLFNPNGHGVIEASVLPGEYSVVAFSTSLGSVSGSFTIEVGEVREVNLVFDNSEIVTGGVTITPMELEDIIAAGIDVDDKENHSYYKVDIVLEFEIITLYIDSNEGDQSVQFINGTPTGENGGLFTPVGANAGGTYYCHDTEDHHYEVYCGGGDDAPQLYIFKIPLEMSRLKEFFEIELEVVNQAVEGITLEDLTATLKVPDGLSLAPTANEQQLTQHLEDLEGGGHRTYAKWILRGDEEGEYPISVDVSGILQPFNLPQNYTFTSNKPLKVWGSTGLRLDLEYDSRAYPDTEYNVHFRLTNIADTPLYDFTLSPNIDESTLQLDEGTLEYYDTSDVWIEAPRADDDNDNERKEDEGLTEEADNKEKKESHSDAIISLGQTLHVKCLESGESVEGDIVVHIDSPEGYSVDGEEIVYKLRRIYVDGNEDMLGEMTVVPVSRYIAGKEYEQIIVPKDPAGDPVIKNVRVEMIDEKRGKYKLILDGYTCREGSEPFFYWKSKDGKFRRWNEDYSEVEFQVNKGIGNPVVVAYVGDGFGYIGTFEVHLGGR